jgi:hypothetical protein
MEPQAIRGISAILFPERIGDGVSAALDEEPADIAVFLQVKVSAVIGRFRTSNKASVPTTYQIESGKLYTSRQLST